MSEISWAPGAWPAGAPPLSDADVRRVLAAALEHGGRPGIELAVTFVGREQLTELHRTSLGDPSPTDVITFDLGEEGVGPAAELYVSVDRAREVAAGRDVSLERELSLYLAHGALHLCGFDDRAEAQREAMRAAERAVLDGLGFAPDAAPHELD